MSRLVGRLLRLEEAPEESGRLALALDSSEKEEEADDIVGVDGGVENTSKSSSKESCEGLGESSFAAVELVRSLSKFCNITSL